MIFEKLVNHYFNVINEFVHINEQPNTETIAMIPGSFKPPHKGHYAMIEHFSNISDRVIVVISEPRESIRRTPGGKIITGNDAREILDIYIKAGKLPNIELVTAPQPVKWVYDFILYFAIILVHPAGIEPATHCLEGSCSIQLSYGCICSTIILAFCNNTTPFKHV